MAGEDKYVYTLAVDYKDLESAFQAVAGIVTRFEKQVGGSTPEQVKRLDRAVTAMLKDFQRLGSINVAPKVDASGLTKASKALRGLTSDLDTAQKKYTKFLAGQATGAKTGKGLSGYSNKALTQYVATAKATGTQGTFVTDAKAELKSRAATAAARKAARATEKQDAAKAANDQIAQNDRVASAQTKADDRNYRSGVAAGTRRAAAFHKAGQQQTADIVAADKAQAAADARYAGGFSNGGTGTSARRNGAATQTELAAQQRSQFAGTFNDVGNARNTAARNSNVAAVSLGGSTGSTLFGRTQQTAEISGQSSKDALSAMREFYAEQDKVGKQTEAVRQQSQASAVAAARSQAQITAAVARTNQQLHDEAVAQLPRLRYALYDVSNATRVLATGTLAAGGAIVKTAVDYDTAFASVKRTSDLFTSTTLNQNQKNTQISGLRSDLVGLSEQLPVTFSDLTKIATLGNQLGIESQDISGFTKTVAQFSAVTGVSVDASATAFGRLGQLLHDSDFRGIGDDIAYLGVKSVATEDEIINTASQLAVSAQGIKLTTADTLALSTSVASLGVQPEQARGTFVRAFGLIGAAVAGGGAKLNDLGRISHLGAAQFKKDWEAGGDSANKAFTKFTNGLGSSTTQINGNLKSVGIIAVRDKQTLGLLAQNQALVATNQKNANAEAKASAAGNGYLAQAYAVTASTTTAKLQVLGNQVLAIFDSIGSSTLGPINLLVDGLGQIAQALDTIAQNPVESTMLAIGVALLLIVGALGLAFSGFVRFRAGLVAFEQLMLQSEEAGVSFFTMLTSLSPASTAATAALAKQSAAQATVAETALAATEADAALADAQALVASGGAGAAEAEVALAAAEADATAAAVAATEAQTALAAANETVGVTGDVAATKTGRLGTLLGKGAGLAGAALIAAIAVPALYSGLRQLEDNVRGLTPDVDDLTKSILGLADAGTKAQSMAALKKALPQIGGPQSAVDDLLGIPQLSGDPLGFGGRSGGYIVNNKKGPDTRINSAQAAANKLATGFTTPGGSVSYANGGGALNAAAAKDATQITNVDKALKGLLDQKDYKGFQQGLAVYLKQMASVGVSGPVAQKALVGVSAALKTTGNESLSAAAKATAAATAVSDAAGAFSSALDEIFSPDISGQTIESDLESLGTAAKNSGATVALSGSQMKTAISDIYASSNDMPTVKGRLESLYEGLIKLGYTDKQLENLTSAIGQIPGPTAAAGLKLDGFTDSLNASGDGADSAASKVKQLSDYSSDLGTALSRAFDLRFSGQDSLDAITSGLRTMKDNAKEAREQVKSLQADLKSLKADEKVDKYQLDLATQFGDTTRATVLRANLAKNKTDQASKQTDLTTAKDKASTKLTGNSDGAIANRATLEGLVKNGQDALTTAAANGASPKQLEAEAGRIKKQIEDQTVALGFNRADVKKSTRAFDDYAKIIATVPRHVTTTIKSNAGPAEKALDEYMEKLKASDGTTVTTKVNQVFTGIGDGAAGDAKASRGDALKAQIAALQKQLSGQAKRGNIRGGLDVQIQTLQAKLAAGQYRDGGYTGNAPRWQVAGQVHGDEFVLNSAAQRMFPRQMLEGANHGVAPQITTVNATAKVPNGMTVGLGRTERALLAQAGGGSGSVTVNADRFGSAMDGSFSRADRRGSN